MRICTFLSLALALLVSACGGGASEDRREFTLQGQVLDVQADRKQALIRHEEIKGLMSAMTMPYSVKDTKELAGIAPGNLINAKLVVLPTMAYLEQVKKVGTAPLELPKDQSPPAATGFELIKTGAPVPNQAFVDQDGKSVNLDAFKGSAVIVTFMYTSCPMPTMCPLMDRNFAKIQAKLKEQGNSLKAHLLSVSFDPQIDTPAVLKTHAASLGADPALWTFVTGDRDAIDKWASGLGMSISRSTTDASDVTHNLRTAILDREGNLVQTYSGNEWTPEQVLSDVRVMVGVD